MSLFINGTRRNLTLNTKAPLCVLILGSLFCFLFFAFFGALQRPTADGVLRDGHLSLSGLQMRAHAMFSAQGLPLGSDTLEYAWLIDMQAGGLTGRVTVPQVCLCVCFTCAIVNTVRNVEGESMCTAFRLCLRKGAFGSAELKLFMTESNS